MEGRKTCDGKEGEGLGRARGVEILVIGRERVLKSM